MQRPTKNRIPYGISNFEKLITQGYYFIDKTPYIELLEYRDEPYLFYLRPRRFGKSMFLSMLEYYYDINRKDKFDTLFKDTYIYKNQTPERSSYMILSLKFSGIRVYKDSKKTEAEFERYIRLRFDDFINTYNLNLLITKDISTLSSTGLLETLNIICRNNEQKIFLLIDEYDNFLNEILVNYGENTYMEITHGAGFIREFFKKIKDLTQEFIIDRVFITGVTPMAMNDLTSGFNIGKNVSLSPDLAEAVGITNKELDDILQKTLPHTNLTLLKQIITKWYNGYTFSPRKPEQKIYNTSLIWYFINEYKQLNSKPEQLFDVNVRTDFNKLKFLISVDSKLNGNFSILKEIAETGKTQGILTDNFSIGEKVGKTEFRSLLFYLGILSLEVYDSGYSIFRIPNRTTEKMIWNYIVEALNTTYAEILDLDRLSRNFYAMIHDGDWKPAFSYILEKFYKAVSIRDFVFHEEGIKTFMLAYLNMTGLFYAKSEVEMNGGYADILIEPTSRLAEYWYLVELKYVKSAETKDETKRQSIINSAIARAKEQLQKYSAQMTGKPAKLIVIVAGAKEYYYLDEISAQ